MSRIIYNIRDMKGGGIVDNGYTKRIRERVLSLEDGTVFVMSDFADIADTSTIRQSLSRLVQSGTLRRILKGVYEKPKYSKLLDEYVAADPEAVANALARSYHWTIAPCGNTALNLLGLSTQVTAVWSYISDGPYKTYEWNSTKLEFKHRTNKEITGSVANVSEENFNKGVNRDASDLLQGKVAGLQITSGSGDVTRSSQIRLRGTSTLQNDQGPMIVIDGVPGGDMSTVSPSDIESISVLKDASSAAIYGAQAANGVILITTKKGTRSGQPKLTYDGYVGVQKTGKRYDVLNSMDRVNLEWDAKASNYALLGSNELPSHVQFGTGERPSIPNYLTQAGAGGRTDINPGDYNYPGTTYAPFSDTNWWDEVDRAAMIQNHQVGLSGGTEKGQYNLSANYFKQDGTVIDSYYQRYHCLLYTSPSPRD